MVSEVVALTQSLSIVSFPSAGFGSVTASYPGR